MKVKAESEASIKYSKKRYVLMEAKRVFIIDLITSWIEMFTLSICKPTLKNLNCVTELKQWNEEVQKWDIHTNHL